VFCSMEWNSALIMVTEYAWIWPIPNCYPITCIQILKLTIVNIWRVSNLAYIGYADLPGNIMLSTEICRFMSFTLKMEAACSFKTSLHDVIYAKKKTNLQQVLASNVRNNASIAIASFCTQT
jgi:hypothetical protein